MNAAVRYGFAPEGVWRGSAFGQGHRRDQAWYSILAAEWPARRAAITAWLADANFDEHGRARSPAGSYASDSVIEPTGLSRP